jgi:hypothetical protein
MQKVCPNPSTIENASRSIAELGHSQNPMQATKISAAPTQQALASLPRSIQRPTGRAMKTGRMAKPAAMMPSHTTGKPSSIAR